MKGETSKSGILQYYTKELFALKYKSDKYNRDKFLSMIHGIYRDHYYVVDVKESCPPQNNRYLPSTFSGSFLLVPYWVSRSGVTFFILATTLPWDKDPYCRDGNAKTVSFKYTQLYNNMREIFLKDIPLWVGSVYKTGLLSQVFREGSIQVSKESIDYAEDYMFKCVSYEEKSRLNGEGDVTFSSTKMIHIARRCIADLMNDLSTIFYDMHTWLKSSGIRSEKKHRDKKYESPFATLIFDLHDRGVEDIFFSTELFDGVRELLNVLTESYTIKNLGKESYCLKKVGHTQGELEFVSRLLWGIDERAPIILQWSKLIDNWRIWSSLYSY